MSVTYMPPKITCTLCVEPMRPATNSEISEMKRHRSLKSLAELATQGNSTAELNVPEWQKIDHAPNTWLMVCDRCGGKVLHSVESKVD